MTAWVWLTHNTQPPAFLQGEHRKIAAQTREVDGSKSLCGSQCYTPVPLMTTMGVFERIQMSMKRDIL